MSRVVFIGPSEIDHLKLFCKELIAEGVPEWGLHIEIKDGQRTIKQNSAIHVFFGRLADKLNDAGLDMKKVLKPHIDIPWTAASVKTWLWKPVMKVMIEKDSTTEMKRSNVTKVYEALNRHLADKFGISVPFPQNQYPEE